MKKYLLVILLACLFCSFIGCGEKDASKTITEINKTVVDKHQPVFTELTLDATEKEMLEVEGKAGQEYPSFYNGTVFQYDKRVYNGYGGSVKYMTDDKGQIACIAWMYENEDGEQVKNAYEELHNQMKILLGESGNDSEAVGNSFGDIWYFDDVHIQISGVITSEYNGLQISYMDAEYSLKDEVDRKKSEREK